MKIDNTVEDYNKKQLEGLSKKQRNLVNVKEAELEQMSNNYKTKEEDLKLQNQTEILELADKHTQEKASEFNREEEYIANYQHNLQNQKQLYEKSLAELRRTNELELKNIQTKHTADLEGKFVTNLNAEKDLNNRVNAEKNLFHENSLREIKDAQHDEFLAVQSVKNKINQNVDNTRAELSPTSARGVIEQKELTRLKHEKQLEIDRQARSQYIMENQLKNSHRFQLDQEQQKFKQDLQTKQDLFVQKYKETEETQKEYLDRIQQKFEDDLRKLTESHAQKKVIHENKQADAFYRITKIEPKITENEKDYTIALPIAEHERDQVQLTAQGRKVHLGYTRRYNDNTISEDGTRSSSSRSETVAREFNIPHILDPKKITQKYENGNVIFKIAKL